MEKITGLPQVRVFGRLQPTGLSENRNPDHLVDPFLPEFPVKVSRSSQTRHPSLGFWGYAHLTLTSSWLQLETW